MAAVFDSATRAVEAVVAAQRALAAEPWPADLRLAVRWGIHTGEVERRRGGIAGIGVHIAARVSGLAGAGEVLVSRTVRDLVTGSGLTFAERGFHTLKGVPDQWEILEAVE